MHILVTGAFGTIGMHVVARLSAEGHAVTCLDLDTRASRDKSLRLPRGVQVRYGDITDRADVEAAVRGQDVVVHLAAIIPPATSANPTLAERVNVGGTENVLAAMASAVPGARLVFPSSVSVHGWSAGRAPPVRVGTPYDGRDDYARHKIEGEKRVRASAARWVILRIGACADPGDFSKGGDKREALAAMFAIAPDTRIEFLHPLDAATAIARACVVPEAEGKILFLGSGAASQLTWRRFVSTFAMALGLGEMPRAWFGSDPYYTDFMDTEESERILRFQEHGYPAYEAAVHAQLRAARWLIMPVRPLVRALLGRAIASARRAP